MFVNVKTARHRLVDDSVEKRKVYILLAELNYQHTTAYIYAYGIGYNLAGSLNYRTYGTSLAGMTVRHNANLTVAVSLARCHVFNLFHCFLLNGLGKNLYVLHALIFVKTLLLILLLHKILPFLQLLLC